ncbi:uncharacterized protein LOC123526812 [Mercenaria mercenaria]|uniref:uncharacterized protein LOC123526812 n=1 Tax=Mercenaria mercenaria TaxID=6596 RepID=UPI00234F4AD3|nr:uncharacterized protein LOC123526812 [Mercenaria mercenaria]
MPTGCSYDAGLYVCDYTTLSGSSLIPLQASGFSPIPQRLKLTGLPTTLNSAVFDTDFASLDNCKSAFISLYSFKRREASRIFQKLYCILNCLVTNHIVKLMILPLFIIASYDTNYPASLELVCENGGSLSVASGFLVNMDHIEDFKITNCDLGNIPANAFSELGTLDRLMIENGTVSSFGMSCLDGLTIVRNASVFPTFPKQHGALIIKNTLLTSGSLPTDLLTGQTDLYEAVFRNMNLTSIDAAVFGTGTSENIRYLDLSHNSLTTLPSDLFSNLNNLGVISLYGMDIDCSCSNLWFMKYAHENYLTLEGDIICNSDKKLAWAFYYSNCVEEEAACSGGIALLDACLTAIDLAGFSVGFIAFVMGWVVLGITIHTRKQQNPAKGKPGNRKPGAKRTAPKKPPKGGWA